jgi:hypothetical protein
VSPCPHDALSHQPTLGSYRITNKDPRKPQSPRNRLINDFQNYLKSTAQCTFINHGIEWDEGEEPTSIKKEVGYIHRWTSIYRKAVIAKMYLLEKWYRENPCDLTMATFTTYQDGKYSEEKVGKLTIEDSFQLLKQSWNKIRMNLRYYSPELSFVYFFEPHKTGYPHLHVLFFGNLTPEIQHKIKTFWSEKFNAGSYEHGVDFKEKREIKSIRNYMIKYFSKILRSETDDWTDGELFFNAIIWKKGYRLWGASQHLSKAMQKPIITEHIEDPEDWMLKQYQWNYTELQDPNGDKHLIRKRQGFEIIEGGET